MHASLLRARPSASSARNFYIDESGNSGDLVKGGDALDFGQQPVFVLAGLGVDDSEGLASALERLRLRHRIKTPELKSSTLKNKPGFVADLIAYLEEGRCPVFIEVVEKRFFICTTMVNHFVIPPVAGEFDRRADVIRMKNAVAEYLHALMPLNVIRAYIDACTAPSVLLTRRAFVELLGWLQSRMPDDSNAEFVHEIVADSFADFETDAKSLEPDRRAFLPVPDLSKAGKPYWLLPNLSSFTNLYARINLFRGKEMDGVQIIHDEQLQYDHVLDDGKRACEEFAERGLTWPLPHADYGFTQGAHLTFASSNASAGIQTADVIAGFVMRYVQSINTNAKMPSRNPLEPFSRC
ncbi:DUF3800 domain-containing protein [Bradyrhizobium sp. IC3123]|uniref:DUF3800 domain-containing protein n=1 Tax=Bradyrhizobium sp. IC3123 TaxID=2793803 RepID=UPI001CD1E41E|nr:DUF3800 domain-containing protein [Bradyrhizobium sp. IC3123]MCA1394554.1 DUF3800 domain-containing protein [Bradyrhizobium sp. IC3123]